MTQPDRRSVTTPATTPASPPGPSEVLEVGSWRDLADLAAALDLLEHHAGAIVRHARTEVCDPAGLQPSPVCVLRPLVSVLHRIEEAFTDLGEVLGSRVEQLRAGVAATSRQLVTADLASLAATSDLARGEV